MISIVIPLYNKYNCIEKCIKSILEQTFTNWELIIINDGSTDNSPCLVEKYLNDQRIKLIHQTNGGVSNARNHGIQVAQGEWIIFIDADDYFLPNALENLYELVIKYKTYISCGNHIVKKDKDEWKFCTGKTEKLISNNYKAWFFHSIFPRTGAALFHHSILKEHLFDETLCRYEDAKSLFEIFRNNEIAYTPKPIMIYSLDNTGLSHRAKDIHKDFIFNMNFGNKSFWEKIALSELLLKGYELYPEYKEILYNKYNKYKLFEYLTKILILYRRIHNKFVCFL